MDNIPPRYALIIAVVIGGYVGEYVFSLLGAGPFSMWGIVGSMIGGFLFLWLTWKAFTVWL